MLGVKELKVTVNPLFDTVAVSVPVLPGSAQASSGSPEKVITSRHPPTGIFTVTETAGAYCALPACEAVTEQVAPAL